ncbi:MAG: MlaD family protein [candidate division Zixibacteria bacterium]|nr:MlaD family protein [candidate division Zixibacteria bacterium]MCI0595688.1 MlaD family protein [candidate division Zixibacteria bacterium]
MKRTGDVRWGGLKLGIVAIIAIGLLLWASLMGGGSSLLRPKNTVKTWFPSLSGLVVGSPVWINGVEVGQVSEIALDKLVAEGKIEISMGINRKYWNLLRQDSKARLGTVGLLGDKYVEIIAGTSASPELKSGDFILGERPVDLASTLSSTPELLKNADRLLVRLTAIADQIDAGRGSIGKLFRDDRFYVESRDAMARIKELSGNLNATQKKVGDRLASLAANLDSLASAMKGTAVKMDTFFTRVEKGEGSLGLLSGDDKLYREAQQTLNEMKRLLADIQKNPKKYVKLSIF